MTSEPNNPGYKPEYQELEEAREETKQNRKAFKHNQELDPMRALVSTIAWLAAEVRVMRLERALER